VDAEITNAVLTFFTTHQYKIYPIRVFTLHLPVSHGVTGICFSVHEVEQFPAESACKKYKVTWTVKYIDDAKNYKTALQVFENLLF